MNNHDVFEEVPLHRHANIGRHLRPLQQPSVIRNCLSNLL